MKRALVLAAGLGSRLRSISGGLPKPLVSFGGQPILAHNLRWLAQAGVAEVWINLHYGADVVRETIGDGSAFGLDIHYVYEPDLLGTAGALANISDAFEARMMVVYGDNVVRFDLDAFEREHQAAGAEISIALFDQSRHLHTGIAGGRVELAGGGRVNQFVEGAATAGLVNAGVYVVEPSVLDLIPTGKLVDFGRDVFPTMLSAGRVIHGRVIDEAGFCLGLDTPESYAVGEGLLRDGRIVLG
jgi:NDP-sugar pyrophosphorylase family protein